MVTRFAGGGAGGVNGTNGDGGPALNASLGGTFGIAFSPRGDLYIADGRCVRKVTLTTPLPPLPPLSRRGGIDLDGQGKSAVVVNSASGNQLQAGR